MIGPYSCINIDTSLILTAEQTCMSFLPQGALYASAAYAVVVQYIRCLSVSVCLSVTLVSLVKTTEYGIKHVITAHPRRCPFFVVEILTESRGLTAIAELADCRSLATLSTSERSPSSARGVRHLRSNAVPPRHVAALTGPECRRLAALTRRQRRVCRRNTENMGGVRQGARLAIDECQHQFQHRRWNCSVVNHVNLLSSVVAAGMILLHQRLARMKIQIN